MKKFITVALVLLQLSLYGQVPMNLFYNKRWELVKEERAFYKREGTIDTAKGVFNGPFKDYIFKGSRIMEGTYQQGKKEGVFTSYYSNGKIAWSGIFAGNERKGKWKYFYANGKEKQEIDFSGKEPRILFLKDSTGKKLLKKGNGKWREEYVDDNFRDVKIIEGVYKNGKRDSVWVCKSGNGNLIYKETYKDGILLEAVWLDRRMIMDKKPNGEFDNKFKVSALFKITEKFETAGGITREDYPLLKALPEKQESRIFTIVEQQPEFPGGFSALAKYLNATMHYPEEARKAKIEGKVFVDFVVEKDGTITESKVMKGVRDDIDAEALRVVKSFPKWKPGRQDGKSVRIHFVLPIAFKLD